MAKPLPDKDCITCQAKIESLADDIAAFHKLENRRAAEQRVKMKAFEDCLNTIKEETSTIKQLKEDTEHTLRLAQTMKGPLIWLGRRIFLPLAYVTGGVYLVLHGDWPTWLEALKALLAEGE